MTAQLVLGLAILVAVAAMGYWLYRRGKDRQALMGALHALEATSDARNREHEILEAAKRVRDTPGPALPDLGGMSDGTTPKGT